MKSNLVIITELSRIGITALIKQISFFIPFYPMRTPYLDDNL